MKVVTRVSSRAPCAMRATIPMAPAISTLEMVTYVTPWAAAGPVSQITAATAARRPRPACITFLFILGPS